MKATGRAFNGRGFGPPAKTFVQEVRTDSSENAFFQTSSYRSKAFAKLKAEDMADRLGWVIEWGSVKKWVVAFRAIKRICGATTVSGRCLFEDHKCCEKECRYTRTLPRLEDEIYWGSRIKFRGKTEYNT